MPEDYFGEPVAERYEAGLGEIRERWSGWKREPFTSDSTTHVSVWERPG